LVAAREEYFRARSNGWRFMMNFSFEFRATAKLPRREPEADWNALCKLSNHAAFPVFPFESRKHFQDTEGAA
jgi:hypothetical protein